MNVVDLETSFTRIKRYHKASKLAIGTSAILVMLYLRLIDDKKLLIPALLFILSNAILTPFFNGWLVEQRQKMLKDLFKDPSKLPEPDLSGQDLANRRQQIAYIAGSFPCFLFMALYSTLADDDSILIPVLAVILSVILVGPMLDRFAAKALPINTLQDHSPTQTKLKTL